MTKSEPVPIVFSSDTYYLPFTAAMIQSVMEHSSPGREYEIFILHRGIPPEYRELLAEQMEPFPNFTLAFVDVSEHIRGYTFFTANRDNITAETYFRLLIPDLLPSHNRVIYLDGDMICLADPAELYAQDPGENLLASSRDILGTAGCYRPGNGALLDYRKNTLGMENPDDYFIAGMLVMNLEKIRQTVSVRELLELAVSREWQCHDQDVLNVLCQGKTRLLGMEWDFTMDDEGASYLPEALKTEYFAAKKAPKIIHYAAESKKPWANLVNVPYFHLFWQYAARTPFTGTIISGMEAKGLIGISFRDRILEDIKNRKIGLGFLLECFKKRFFG